MKKLGIFAVLVVLALAAVALAQGNQGKGQGKGQGQQGQQQGQRGQGQQGQDGGMSCTMTQEVAVALYEALVSGEGEYAAYATYGAVIDKFGQVEPYVSIQQAEGKHIDALKRQMDKYGISYPPENPYLGNVVAPESLEEAAKAWAVGEIANVELYDRLLEASQGCSDVTRVFTNLRNASQEMHLPAFELAAQSGGTLSPEQMQTLSSEHHKGGTRDCEHEGNHQNQGQQGNGYGNNQGGQHQGQMGQGQQGNGKQGQNRVADIMAEFNNHDLDGNGLISKEEFFNTKTANMVEKSQAGYEMKNVANAPAFEDIDTNSDDNISMEEFGKFMIQHQEQNQMQMGQGNAQNQGQQGQGNQGKQGLGQAARLAQAPGVAMALPVPLPNDPSPELIRSTLLDVHDTLCADVGYAAEILMKTQTLAKAVPVIMEITGLQPGDIETLEQATCNTDLSNASVVEIRESNRIAAWLVDLHLVGINQALSAE